jgi:hypothetical protein
MSDLLRRIFEGLEQENILYCVMRDGDRLGQLAHQGEIDLLIAASQLPRLRRQLTRLGFINLPGWGHAPHHFFIAFDPDMEDWIKLDVVTKVAYGKPVQALRTSLATGCLSSRRRSGLAFIPAPEIELVTLLLHCILDKGYFAPARGQRLKVLCSQVTDTASVSRWLSSYGTPALAWPQLAALIEAENWTALLAERQALVNRLSSRDRLGTLFRQVRDRVLRKLNRWVSRLRPRVSSKPALAWRGCGDYNHLASAPSASSRRAASRGPRPKGCFAKGRGPEALARSVITRRGSVDSSGGN